MTRCHQIFHSISQSRLFGATGQSFLTLSRKYSSLWQPKPTSNLFSEWQVSAHDFTVTSTTDSWTTTKHNNFEYIYIIIHFSSFHLMTTALKGQVFCVRQRTRKRGNCTSTFHTESIDQELRRLGSSNSPSLNAISIKIKNYKV